MATPDELRKRQEQLTRLAANDLAALWRQVSNAVEANQALRTVLPSLLQTYGQAAAALAADWYDEARHIAEVGGAFTAIPADFADQGVDELAGWASNKGTDLDSIRTLAEGGMQRRIATWSRETIVGSALADPAADGWQRVGLGSCAFCRMLIGRGAVYTEATADFASHDHCNCAAVPAFRGKPRPVKKYTPGASDRSKADGADYQLAKAWIDTHM
jgi:hypothetical protein